MQRTRLVASVLFLFGALSGCVEGTQDFYAFDLDAQYKNPGVFPGNYSFGNGGSTVLKAGLLQSPREPEVVRLRSTLPAYPTPAGESTTDGAVFITMAIWRPLNATGPVPVIVDAGPYYEQTLCLVPNVPVPGGPAVGCRFFLNTTIDMPQQTTPFSLKNFLPLGYAVVQLAVRGTGTSGGCMDLLGPSEQHDLDQAITWLGEQPWSNGNVAMWGASYDGSTPWEVAAAGNPHLKTIIPVSGLPDIYDLMFHNGTPEGRGAIMHHYVYWSSGFSHEAPFNQLPPLPPLPVQPPVPLPALPPGLFGQASGREPYQDLQNLLCPEVYRGIAMGGYSSATGDRGAAASDYWTVRDHRQAVLDDYKGSVFLIHGLQDWNVDPHAAIPFNVQLRAKGIEMKEWYGQWGHAFPDSTCIQATPAWVSLPCRLDFAEVLGRWLDRYLKGDTGQDLGPSIQVEDDLGQWRNADSFPPAAPAWKELRLGDGRLAQQAPAASTVRLEPGSKAGPGNVLEFKGEPLAQDLHLSGLPQLRIPFTPQGEGGQLAAWLFDEDAEGQVRAPAVGRDLDTLKWEPAGLPIVGRAHLNLRYHAGGEAMQPLVPGQRYVARMEFEPLEVHVPKGHRLTLWLFQGYAPDHQGTWTAAPVDVHLGPDAVLRLSTIDLDPTTVFPVPGVHFPQRGLLEKMHLDKPDRAPTDGTPRAPVCIPGLPCVGVA